MATRQAGGLEGLEARLLLADAGDLLSLAEVATFGQSSGACIRDELLGDGPNAAADVDLYVFTAAKGDTVVAETARQVGVEIDTDTVLRLFDAAGVELAVNDDRPGSKHSGLSYFVLASGTYYLGVSGAGNVAYDPVTGAGATDGATGSYALNLRLEQRDAGDTLATARNTNQGPNGGQFEAIESIGRPAGGGGAFGLKDVDFYKIRVASGDQVRAVTSLPPGDGAVATSTLLRLFNSAGQPVATSAETSGYATLDVVVWEADDYYVAVSGRPNATYDPLVGGSGADAEAAGDYRLQIVMQTSLSDVGDTIATARPKNLLPGRVSSEYDLNTIANGDHGRRDVDLYAVTVADGDRLTAATSLPPGGTPMGTAVRLFDAAGTELAFAADASGYAAIAGHFFPVGGTYYVGISSAANAAYDPLAAGSGAEGATGSYAVTFTLAPHQDWGATFPDAQVTGLTPETPFTQAYERLGNHFVPDADVDLYRFDAAKGYTLTATTSKPFPQLADADTVLRLFDVAGNELARADDGPSPAFAILKYTFAQGGRYYLGVSGAGNDAYDPTTGDGTLPGATGAYRLDMTLSLTDVGDSLAAAEPTGVGPLAGSAAFNESIGNGEHGLLDVDVYTIDGAAGQIVSAITFNPVGGVATDVAVRLFDASGAELARSQADSGYGALSHVLAAAGTYYVAVSGLPNLSYAPGAPASGVPAASEGDYRLTLALADPPPDVGDDRASALPTGLAPGVAGAFSHADVIGNGPHVAMDVDVYRFDVGAGDVVDVATSLPAGGAPGALVLRLLDASGAEVALATGTPDGYPALAGVRLLTAGTYYVAVSGAPNAAYHIDLPGSGVAGATASYALSIDVQAPPDAGQVLAQAVITDLAPSHAGFVQAYENLGSPSPAGAADVDLYRFDALAGQTLLARTLLPLPGALPADTVLRLFDALGNPLALADDGPDGSPYAALVHTFAATGTYFVGVSGAGNSAYDPAAGGDAVPGATGSYRLELSLDVAETIAGAQPTVASGAYAATGRIGDGPHGLADVDLYRVSGAAGDQLTVTTSTPAGGVATGVALRLFDAAGNVLAVSAPVGGLGTLNVILPFAGEFFVGVSGSGNVSYDPAVAGSGSPAAAAGDYRLDLLLRPALADEGDAADSALDVPLDPGVSGSFECSGVIGNGAHAARDVDVYRIVVGEGDVLTIASAPSATGVPMVLALRLFDASGQLVASAVGDAAQPYPSLGSVFQAVAGTCFLAVSSADNLAYDLAVPGSGTAGATGTYDLAIALAAPPDAGGTLATAVVTGAELGSPYVRPFEKLGDVAAGEGDIDLYAFYSPGAQILRVTTAVPAGAAGPTDTVVRLFDASGNALAIAHDDHGGGSPYAWLCAPLVAAGTYYVGVSGAGNVSYSPVSGAGGVPGATGSYLLRIELFPGEPGDRLDHAEVLPLGPGAGACEIVGTIGDGIYGPLDVDLYRFVTAAGDHCTARLSLPPAAPDGGPAVPFDAGLRLFDAAGAELARSDNDSGYASLNVLLPVAGTYHLAVSGLPNMEYEPATPASGVAGAEGHYRLSMGMTAASADVGDSMSEALDTGLLPYAFGSWSDRGQVGNGPFGDRDVDVFRLELGEGDRLSIVVTLPEGQPAGPLVLRLLDADGQEVARHDGSATSYPQLADLFMTDAGTYYVVLSGAGNDAYDPAVGGSGSPGATGAYDLALTVTPSPDVGDNRADSEVTGLAFGTPYIRAFERIGSPFVGGKDVDLYRFNASSGQSLLAVTSHPFGEAAQTDTVIRLFNAAGDELARSDDGPDGSLFATLRFNFYSEDVYYLGVSGAGNTSYHMLTGEGAVEGATGSYRLELHLLPPMEASDSLAAPERILVGPGPATFSYVEKVGDGPFGDRDVDLYVFTGGPGDQLNLTTSLPAGGTPASTVVRLFNAFGQELARSTQAGGYGSLSFILPRAGEYAVSVSAYPNADFDPFVPGSGVVGGGQLGDYRLDLTLQPAPPDAGDTLATARDTLITGGVAVHFSDRDVIGNGLHAGQDVDLYRLQLAQGDVVDIATLPTPGGVPMRAVLRLFDAAGNELLAAAGVEGVYPALADFLVPATGTYYVGVSGWQNTTYLPGVAPSGPGGVTGSYRLLIDVAPAVDAGSSFADAVLTNLVPGAAGYVRNFERLGNAPGPVPAADIDVYRFDATAGQTLRARTLAPFASGPAADTVLRLYGPTGILLASNDDDPAQAPWSLLEHTFAANGTYHLVVSGAGNVAYDPVSGAGAVAGATGAYRLELHLDVGDTLAGAMPAAGPTFSNFVVEGRTGDGPHAARDVDLYRVEGFAGGTLTVEISPAQGVTPPLPQHTVVRIFAEDGTPLAIDTGGGTGGYANFAFPFPATGTYYVGVSGFDNVGYDPLVGGSGTDGMAGGYRLSLSVAEPPDTPHTLATAAPLGLGPGLGTVALNGILGNGPLTGRDVDLFRFDGIAGQLFVARTSLPPGSVRPADTFLVLFDAAGNRLATADDAAPDDAYSLLEVLLPATGTYYLGVSGEPNVDYAPADGSGITFGSTGDYRLEATLRYNGRIAGTVWADRDADGDRDPGEGGLAGWTVFLDLDGDGAPGPAEPQRLTDASGAYAFDELPAGGYLVRAVVPGAEPWSATSPAAATHAIALAAGQSASSLDFGFRPLLASVVVEVFNDFDTDGIRAPAEPPFAGVLVRLFDPVNGIVGDGDDVELAVRLTDPDGRAAFDNLPPAAYYVEIARPDKHAFGPQDQGGDDALDSDVHPVTGRTAVFDAAVGSLFTFGASIHALPDLQGTDGDDTFYLRLDDTGTLIQVYAGEAPLPENLLLTFKKSLDFQLSVSTFGGDDRLILDLTRGAPMPADGIAFDGGAHALLGDRLEVIGDGGGAAFSPSGTTPGSGTLNVGGRTLTFASVEPLHLANLAVLVYTAPNADDHLTVDTPAPGTGRIAGFSSGTELTPVSFRTVTQLVIDLAANDAKGAGDDTFAVGPTGLDAAGLSSLTVRAGRGANSLVFAGGNTTLTPSLTDGGTLSLLARNAAVVNVAQALDLASLTLEGSSVVRLNGNTAKTIRTRFLSLAPAARLDLGENDLIVATASPAERDAALAAVQALIASARNGETWTGPGLTSSAAAADASRATGVLAIANVADGGGANEPLHRSFGGFAVDANAVLVKHTYDGDFNLDGRVDAADYFRIDRGRALGLAGTVHGDADADGVVSPDDYLLADRAFLRAAATGQTFVRGTVSLTPDGWTVVTPARDSRIVYVSSSAGDDANDGLSPDRPVATLARAQQLVRDDMPDQILLRRGDVWEGQRFENWSAGGRSEHEPLLIGAYGPGADRPLIRFAGPGAAFSALGSGDIAHLAIIGVHFQGVGDLPGAGLDRTSPGGNFLIEDAVFERFSTGLSVQGFYSRVHGVTIRRSRISDNFPTLGHAQGIYMNDVSGILIEENLIDHNGWREPDRSDATQFNHNVYLAADTDDVVVRRNVIANASSHGLQARSGGVVEDNVFFRNPIGMSFGLVNGAGLYPGGVSGRVSGNLFLEANDINAQASRGWALEISNVRPGSGTVVRDNIFAFDNSAGTFAAIQLAVPSGASNPAEGVGIRDLLIEDNVVYRWEASLNFSNRLTPGGADYTGYAGLVVRNNDFQTFQTSGAVFYSLTHFTPFDPALESWSDNLYYATLGMETWFRLGPDTDSFAEWFQKVEPTARAGLRDYADPERSLGTYAASIGIAPTVEHPDVADAFLAAARAQSRATWSPVFSADAILAHVRAGFQGDAVEDVPLPHGLTATYFGQPDFTDPLVFRTDPDLNFTWFTTPAGDVGPDRYSVAWSGLIEVPASGVWTFHATGNDGLRLWLDGKLVADAWATGTTVTDSFDVALEAGRRYAIGVEMFDDAGVGVARLEWEGPGTPRQVVPPTAFYVQPPPVPPVRIAALGDSLTEGQAGHATWRYWLDRHLDHNGHQTDLVGPRSGVAGPGSPLYGNFDADHAGFSGLRTDQVLALLAGDPSLLASADVVLLMLGTEDLLQGVPAATIAANVGAIVNALRLARPTVKVALAQVPPPAGLEAAAAELNVLLAQLALAIHAPGSPVVGVDLFTGFDPVTDTYDGVHPDESGERLVARRFFAAVQALLSPSAGPDAPPASPAILSARPRSAQRVDLVWSDSADNEAGYLVQRRPAGAGEGAWQTIAALEANVTSHVDRAGLAGVTSYEYRVLVVNAAGAASASPVAAVTTTDLTFFRAINLGGPAVVIDGQQWDGHDAPGYSFTGSANVRDDVTLDFPASVDMTAMLRSFIVKGTGTNVSVAGVPAGTYLVKLYNFEDSFPFTFNVQIEGQTVATGFNSGNAGTWSLLGPYTVTVTDGSLDVQISNGDFNLSGIEIWRVG